MFEELLRQLRLLALQDGDLDSQRLVDWLRRHSGAEIAVVDGRGNVEASTPGLAPETLAEVRPVLDQVSHGRLDAGTTQVDGLQVRCEPLGREVPRPVLVVAGDYPLDRDASALASQTGTVLGVLRRLKRANELTGRYNWMAERHRFAVFMTLMAGDLATARRVTVGSVPPVLDATRVRVHLLRCTPRDRVLLADAHQDEHGYHGRGLMVRCPVYDDNLICLVPADEPGSDLRELLRTWVRDDPHYMMGISAPHPLEATADAYDQARHALAVARHSPSRIADFQGNAPLADLLPRQQALAWADAVLRPLNPLPRLTSDVTGLVLSFPRAGVAKVLGISRNTVTAHVRQAEHALGLDLDGVRSRADLALALVISGLNGRATTDPPTSLDDLLATEPAVTWSRTFLRPLHKADGPVLETLRAWVRADTDAQRAARELGISRATVRSRVRSAEGLLDRELLNSGPGTYDLVHALHIADRAP